MKSKNKNQVRNVIKGKIREIKEGAGNSQVIMISSEGETIVSVIIKKFNW
jgi:molybdopterin-binding protein